MFALQVDINAQPQAWIPMDEAAKYYATDSVAWTVGDVMRTLRGGRNSVTGVVSSIDIHPVIAVRGACPINLFEMAPALTNDKLFRRDLYRCCYCFDDFGPYGKGLTRDHIVPTSKGGGNVWENVSSACRLLHECGMQLLMVPYRPSVVEDFILRGRHISGDAYEWLKTRLPRGSRLRSLQ